MRVGGERDERRHHRPMTSMPAVPKPKKPRPRAVGRRGGTSSRVAWYRHLTMDRALWERVERDKT
jgi:hypothetical protein